MFIIITCNACALHMHLEDDDHDGSIIILIHFDTFDDDDDEEFRSGHPDYEDRKVLLKKILHRDLFTEIQLNPLNLFLDALVSLHFKLSQSG